MVNVCQKSVRTPSTALVYLSKYMYTHYLSTDWFQERCRALLTMVELK